MIGIWVERRARVLGVVGFLLIALGLAVLPLTTALFFAGALLLVGALFFYPEVAVYLLVFAVPFGSLLPLNVGGANATAADALLLLAWGLYLARGIARRDLQLRIPQLALPFVIFIFAAFLSFTVALSLKDAVTELVKWIEMLAAYWLVAQFFDERRVEVLLAVMFAAGLGEALLGVYQYYFQLGPEGFLLFGGANLRAYGTFEQPNPYAGYLGLMIPLAFGTAVGIATEDGRRRVEGAAGRARVLERKDREMSENCARRTWRAKAAKGEWGQQSEELGIPFRRILLGVLAVGSLVAMGAALFYSYSRGAWIGVAAALVTTAVLALVRSKRAAMITVGLALLVLVVIGLGEINVVPEIITERFATVGDYFGLDDVRGVRANDENFALVERRAHWQAALGMFEDSPWLGVGFGNYAIAYPKYSLPHWDDPLGHAHNYYLNVLAEAGGIGFVAYLLLWGAIFWVVWRATRRSTRWAQGVAADAFGVLVALSIHNFFDNLFVHAMYIQVGLTLGLVEALIWKRKPRDEKGNL